MMETAEWIQESTGLSASLQRNVSIQIERNFIMQKDNDPKVQQKKKKVEGFSQVKPITRL